MASLPLNPALLPLAFLLGTWRGEGVGEYPTIKPFRYREDVTFGHSGKAFLIYSQRTQAVDDGRPLHAETGYIRATDDGQVEMIVAQAIGFAEISLGRVSATRLDLQSAHLTRTPTAKNVTAIARRIWLEDDILHYELAMAMSGGELAGHLAATLRRAH
jgi:THAP4-like, heme-binding beta-barrel domain